MGLRFEGSGNEGRKRKAKRGLGFYLSIVLCCGAVALLVATSTFSADDESNPRSMDSAALASQTAGQTGEDVSYSDSLAVDETAMDGGETSDAMPQDAEYASATTEAAVTTTTATAPTTAPTVATSAAAEDGALPVSAAASFRLPTDGSMTGGFSGDELIYCATMCDWRTHNGIDIAGKPGAPVVACADGIVESFTQDMLYGNTAIIKHSDDIIVYYCGLADTQMVTAGLQVKAGDVIGYIGVVPCESADEPHIHLAVMKDGQFVDPAALLGIA